MQIQSQRDTFAIWLLGSIPPEAQAYRDRVKGWRDSGHKTDYSGQVMYHSTTPKRRDLVDKHGLLTSQSVDTGNSPGVYMTPTEPERSPYQDIWAIDTSKLNHLERDDPHQEYEFGGSYWTKNDVPRDAMKLHYQGDQSLPGGDW